MNADLLLALDQGTTSTRAIAFDAGGTRVASASRPLTQIYPQPGWVEHDPRQIWRDAHDVCKQVIAQVGGERIAALGITNQRETSVLWDRKTGDPVMNAIVWQDRRTADLCHRLAEEGWQEKVRARSGLLLDPYFSATKLAWMIENVPGVAARARAGALAFGTIDCWLAWNLTGGDRHITDATNAARTMLFDITTQAWDGELLEHLAIPEGVLPEVVDVHGELGETRPGLFDGVLRIMGMAGDQQAALVGQACFNPGDIKATFGTGCFVMVNTGGLKVVSEHKLLATSAYRTGSDHAYALEGSIFMAGAVVQWLRDNLGVFKNASETAKLAENANPASTVVLVPAFTGLGAPHWVPDARAAIFGLTRGDGRGELVRAGLESVAYQTLDLMTALASDLKHAGLPLPESLRVDGGMAENNWFMQFLADVLDLPVERARQSETTALGAACLAGLGAGLLKSFDDIVATRQPDARFEPKLDPQVRREKLRQWADALALVLSGGKPG